MFSAGGVPSWPVVVLVVATSLLVPCELAARRRASRRGSPTRKGRTRPPPGLVSFNPSAFTSLLVDEAARGDYPLSRSSPNSSCMNSAWAVLSLALSRHNGCTVVLEDSRRSSLRSSHSESVAQPLTPRRRPRNRAQPTQGREAHPRLGSPRDGPSLAPAVAYSVAPPRANASSKSSLVHRFDQSPRQLLGSVSTLCVEVSP